ncbi:hypothetical protein, partial [Porphyromonas gingivalis]|uniref:hypothetical protein n=1 Tax=Porphyromonas gingivalis TaxID=837 RepID=UPI001C54DE49
LKPNDLEAAPSSRSLCSRRITKEYDLQLLVIFMVCSLRSNWRIISATAPCRMQKKKPPTEQKRLFNGRHIEIMETLLGEESE